MNPDKIVDDKLLPFLKQLADKCLEDAATLTFDKEHPQHLYAICTYVTILETTYEILPIRAAIRPEGARSRVPYPDTLLGTRSS